jgi:hypothetical protein
MEDTLQGELEDREAITALMELYDVDESIAKELWKKFIETVEAMKVTVQKEKRSAEAKQ